MAEIPGLNSFNPNPNRLPPAQRGVPDLILNTPAQGRGTAAPVPAQAPHPAPAAPIVQQNAQSLLHALTEMNIVPTQHNLQIAQSLAGYGQPVSQRTMQIVQQALARLGLVDQAGIEAVVILLAGEQPVTPEAVRGLRQMLGGQALFNQIAQLPQNLQALLSQLKTPQQQQQLEQLALKGPPASAPAALAAPEAAKSSVVQQAAGQAQVVESRQETGRLIQPTTAQKIDQAQEKQPTQQSQEPHPALNVRRPPQDNQQALELHLQRPPELDWQPAGRATASQMPQAFIRQLQEILQLTQRLLDASVLKNMQQLGPQQQQIAQLLGTLAQRTGEFRALFQKLFPDLAAALARSGDADGIDVFSRLAHLLQEQTGQLAGNEPLLAELRQLLEQVGGQMDKLHTHFMARETLLQQQPGYCLPFMVSVKGELFPAELKVEYQQDQARPGAGGTPVKISLSVETKHLGRIHINLATLEKDMDVALKVTTRRVQKLVEPELAVLKGQLESRQYHVHQLNCQVEPDLAARQSLLLPPKYPIRSLKRVEGVV